ncbi:hypothetical protein L9F63_003514, partial [Diploptera punctata]
MRFALVRIKVATLLRQLYTRGVDMETPTDRLTDAQFIAIAAVPLLLSWPNNQLIIHANYYTYYLTAAVFPYLAFRFSRLSSCLSVSRSHNISSPYVAAGSILASNSLIAVSISFLCWFSFVVDFRSNALNLNKFMMMYGVVAMWPVRWDDFSILLPNMNLKLKRQLVR